MRAEPAASPADDRTAGHVRVGVVDCGTNATRLLVADVGRAAPTSPVRVEEITRRLIVTRMGAGIDGGGRIGDDALGRVEDALRTYVDACRDLGVMRIAVLATSAAREAANADAFGATVVRTIGVRPEVITGDEEAAATYRGALTDLPTDGTSAGRTLVVDLGGGSTELAVAPSGDGAGEPPLTVSVAIGSVRLTERLLRDDPPSPAQIAAAREAARDALTPALRRLRALPATGAATGSGIGRLVAVAGTALTLGALHLGLDDPDAPELHGARLPAARLHERTAMLLATPTAEIADLPAVVPGRADVLAGGALVLDQLVALAAVDGLVLSRRDLLDDLALRVGLAG